MHLPVASESFSRSWLGLRYILHGLEQSEGVFLGPAVAHEQNVVVLL